MSIFNAKFPAAPIPIDCGRACDASLVPLATGQVRETMDNGRATFSVLFLCAVLCLPPFVLLLFSSSGLYEVREIKPHIFVWIPEDVLEQEGDPQFHRPGNAGFVITPEAILVVNTTNSPFHARELLYEIRRRSEAPVKYVVNTDSHGDDVLGNEVFVDQEATIVSTSAVLAEMRQYHRELRRRLEDDFRLQARLRGFHFTLPSRTFDSETSLQLSGEEIKLLDLDKGPSDAGAAVYLPSAKVLFLGDLFENEFFPRVGTRNFRRWIEILQRVESWDVEAYVPAHGTPAGKRELIGFRHFLEWLLNEVEACVREGKTLEQVKNQVRPLENYHWHAPELASEAVEAVYRQLSGDRSSSSPISSPAN